MTIERGTTEITPMNDPVYNQQEDVLRPWVDSHNLRKLNGTWYKDRRRVVIGGLHDKSTIIHAHHNSPVYGHPGIKRTIHLTERTYWWPGLRRDVLDYVKGCADCQRHKVNMRPTRAPLYPITPLTNALPWLYHSKPSA